MLPYIFVFIGSLLVDCIPIVAPPAWMLMLFIMIKFDLNPYFVVLIGTMGTVCGRIVYMTYIIPWLGRKTIGVQKDADLRFLGEKLSQERRLIYVFVFIYSVLPLSTTALFTATALARVKKRIVVPPFFFGNLIGDGLLLVSGRYAIDHFSDFYKDSLNAKNIFLMLFAFLFVTLFLFVNWRELLENKKIRFKWKFWL
ncbi:MAG: hypothetical protein H7256_04320 [Bdellovibrio sp.]|nr:hypothetical protein [Bdellovibrio sp.]